MTADNPYPGSTLCAADVLRLADTYWLGAEHMLSADWVNKPSSSAPFRLIAIHAIELYLNAFLLASGVDAATIRGMQHNLALRADLVKASGMVLPGRTFDHLRFLSEQREYLVSRYGTPVTNGTSQTNRLCSTLRLVRKRVTAKVEQLALVAA